MKLVYKKVSEDDYAQKYIEDGESVPDGWTDDVTSLNIQIPLSETDILKQENEELKMRLDAAEMTQLETLDMMFNLEMKLEGGETK